jgi:hypothetical protein
MAAEMSNIYLDVSFFRRSSYVVFITRTSVSARPSLDGEEAAIK